MTNLYHEVVSGSGLLARKTSRHSLDGFEQNIGPLWTSKILKGKKITSTLNKEALTFCQSKCHIRLFSSCSTLGFLMCQAANVYGITTM